MLIIGAKGFAKEVLEVLYQLNDLDNIVFYDDVNIDAPNLLYNKYPVLKSIEEAKQFIQNVDKRFTIGIGNPVLRKKVADTFTGIGGILTSVISPKATIGYYGNKILEGCNIMSGVRITSDIKIDKGVLINLNSTIGHDSLLSKFVEISPGACISGNCQIGNFSFIGTNATILPNIVIGKNCIVAAGAVVTTNVPDNCLVAGIPAIIKKQLKPLSF